MKHTPKPTWSFRRFVNDHYGLYKQGHLEADCWRKESADEIMRSCNSQLPLLDAAKALLTAIGGEESTDVFCVDLRNAIANAEGR